jgi:hypothetical protein
MNAAFDPHLRYSMRLCTTLLLSRTGCGIGDVLVQDHHHLARYQRLQRDIAAASKQQMVQPEFGRLDRYWGLPCS